jgi:hypothetical protein
MTKYYLFSQRLMAEERNFTSSLVFHDSVQIDLPPPEEDFLKKKNRGRSKTKHTIGKHYQGHGMFGGSKLLHITSTDSFNSQHKRTFFHKSSCTIGLLGLWPHERTTPFNESTPSTKAQLKPRHSGCCLYQITKINPPVGRIPR